jgi:hypothetical protein
VLGHMHIIGADDCPAGASTGGVFAFGAGNAGVLVLVFG